MSPLVLILAANPLGIPHLPTPLAADLTRWHFMQQISAPPSWWLVACLLASVGAGLGWWLPKRLQQLALQTQSQMPSQQEAPFAEAFAAAKALPPFPTLPTKQRLAWAGRFAVLGAVCSLLWGFSAGWGGFGFGVWVLLLSVVAVIDQRLLLVEAWPVLLGLLLRWAELAWFAPSALQPSVLAGLAGAGGLYLIGFAHVALRGQLGLGEGDGAVFALVCAQVGLTGAPLALGLAASLALIFGLVRWLRHRSATSTAAQAPIGWNTPLPLAPFLLIGGVTTRLVQVHGLWA